MTDTANSAGRNVPRLYVTYDANVYRTLSAARCDALHRAERSHGIVAVATYAVVTELVAHLASPDDPHFGSCWHALRRLASHCRRYNGARTLIEFAADAEDQIDGTESVPTPSPITPSMVPSLRRDDDLIPALPPAP